ncbi:MAG: phosphoribosylformylglycinamidine cyclo-ligase [Planctomycetota bacterium]|nr:phosphoribosylformylglycinamidine cyclo-ligase [Planctomycetota bacterium]
MGTPPATSTTTAPPGPTGGDLSGLFASLIERTHTPRVLEGLRGGPTSAFSLDFAEGLLKRHYRDGVLVACAQGVGDKLALARAAGVLEPVGFDLPALAVNDLACLRAEPLFFLASLALSDLAAPQAEELVKGMARGCLASGGMAMLGGRAEALPEVFKDGAIDLAGFAVGIVERHKLAAQIVPEAGDCAIALASSGLHAHGFALARRALLGKAGFALADTPAELEGASLAQALLTPTRIYGPGVLELLGRYRVKRVVRGLAHVKEGGLPAALAAALPAGLCLRVKRDAWTPGLIFALIARAGAIDHDEMFHSFNMGVGFVLFVSHHFVKPVLAHLRQAGERCWVLGKLVAGDEPLCWA